MWFRKRKKTRGAVSPSFAIFERFNGFDRLRDEAIALRKVRDAVICTASNKSFFT